MSREYIKYVDPFIGVDGDANCLCGPFLPFSMARPGPDTLPPHPPSGYKTGEPIAYFSQNHVSGTGGGGRYGNIGVMPFVGSPTIHPLPQHPRDEFAGVGYYRARLGDSGIVAELTATEHTGVYSFAFPSGALANVMIDTGTVIKIGGRSQPGKGQGIVTGGFSEVVGDSAVAGRADCKGGWGHDYPYTVYFYALFDKAFDSCFSGAEDCIFSGEHAFGAGAKTVLRFGCEERVELRIGISYVSIANARSYVEKESSGIPFEDLRRTAENIWHEKLSSIKVKGGDEDAKKLFYTSMYRLMCMPTDLGVDTENHLWKSGVRAFTDYYCLWDSVRNANSLLGLIYPEKEVELLNSLLDVAEHRGWLPDAWIAGHSAHVQGGSSADVLFCEAMLKGLKGIDYEKALSYMIKNAEKSSPDPVLFGRYIDDYNSLGFVSDDVINCVSRHIEYSYQDYCIGRLADCLEHKDTALKYYRNSERLWNLWRNDLKCFAPKKKDGSWIDPFDPSKPMRKDYWNDPYFYEGTGYEWSFCGLHDIEGLVDGHGGAEEFSSRLDAFFEKDIYNWKEIILHTPYLYHYAGRPDKSSEKSRSVIAEKYTAARDGLPDNEDMGAHSAFYICSAIGLYPVMGQDVYLLSTPFFQEVEISPVNSTQTFRVHLEGDLKREKYIVSATLNGERLNRAWLTHEEISGGGDLILELGTESNVFGNGCLPLSPLRKALGDY